MRKEEFFHIIGEVDEQKVAAAGMAMTAKKKPRLVWLKWGALAACLCLVVVGVLTFNNNLHQKSAAPLAGGFIGEVIEIVNPTQCKVEVTAGDHNLPEGATAYVIYEKIVYNSEIYSKNLVEGDTVVVTYDSIQLKKKNNKVVITIDSIELADKIEPTE